MKKTLFLTPFLAVALFSCSDKEVVGPERGQDDGDPNYLAVKIITNSTQTRANFEDDYKDGSDDENAVKSIRFYLFDSQGQPFSTPYVDANPGDGTLQEQDKPNVEKVLEAVIVFQVEKGGATPSQILAVLNPREELDNAQNKNKTVAGFMDIIDNYNTDGEAQTFVMSNSVYREGEDPENEILELAHIAESVEGCVALSREAALANPVEIYVERVVAKVETDISKINNTKVEGKDNIYELKYKDGKAINDKNNQQIYLKLLGWNVTATADRSRLVKKINTGWKISDFDWGEKNDWNYPNYHRSYWALNPEGINFQYGNFGADRNDATKKSQKNFGQVANAVTNFDEGYTYVQENAANKEDGSKDDTTTKLIVAGQLVNKDGKAIDIAQWMGGTYTQDDLKQALATASNLCKVTNNGSGYTYTPIQKDDIEFVSNYFSLNGESLYEESYNKEGNTLPEDKTRYWSYAHVKSTSNPEGTNWAVQTGTGYNENINPNEVLKSLGYVKVWTNGYTYYWTEINHLNPNEGGIGSVGIVRNHIYRMEIEKIQGLGVPVNDPDEMIIPEEPDDPEQAFISAQVKILRWRLVNDNVVLGW